MRINGLLYENETTPVPGTESGTGEPPAPPAAEPSTTDTGQGTPDAIPYARFKEVNDKLNELKPFEALVQLGYDPDSLGELAAFEAAYFRDPIETLKTMTDNLDLPEDRKVALRESLDSAKGATIQPAEGQSSGTPKQSDDEPPAWAKPLLDDHQKRTAAEVEEGNQAMVDKIVSHWKQLDTKAGVKETADRVILRYIASMQPRGDLTTVEQMAEAVRTEFMDDRDALLGEAVQGRPTGPRAVPGSGVAPTPPQDFHGDLKAASRAARAALEAGTLGA